MESDDPRILASLVTERNHVIWVPTTTRNNNNNNNNNDNNETKPKTGANPGAGCASGPTTDAGKKRQEEKEEAKSAKKEKRRERNRKKQKAYRARKREKKGVPSSQSGSSSRFAWTKEEQTGSTRKEKKKSSKDGRRGEEKSKKSEKSGSREAQKELRRMQRLAARGDESAWEELMAKALSDCDFSALQSLFLADLKCAAKRSAADDDGDTRGRVVTKRYRVLSARFHPDKHADEAECYTIAFQALNEARGMVKL